MRALAQVQQGRFEGAPGTRAAAHFDSGVTVLRNNLGVVLERTGIGRASCEETRSISLWDTHN